MVLDTQMIHYSKFIHHEKLLKNQRKKAENNLRTYSHFNIQVANV